MALQEHNDCMHPTTKPTDNRFRKLVPETDWQKLPLPVQKRFSKRVSGEKSAVYIGTITQMRMSFAGRVLAQLLRAVGAPLPLKADIGTPSVVSVTEDCVKGGQVWTRLYANRSGFPQIIHSAKRFGGHTGLEEYIGFGITMALAVRVIEKSLCFESCGYQLALFGLRIKLPRVLTPFDLLVKHEDAGGKQFIFSLRLTTRWFGELMYQQGLYEEERLV